MRLQVPSSSIRLMQLVYRKILPQVRQELAGWRRKAMAIPDPELREQALASISMKAFHCHGGGVYALLAGNEWKSAVRFIVAYQTISDYLDNLCDRSTSLDPEDFAQLHLSMQEAIDPETGYAAYYAKREAQDDGGYLQSLVQVCQTVIAAIPESVRPIVYLEKLNRLYCDLQIHKHVVMEERLPRLKQWYNTECDFDDLQWQEFAAASGSTLGIFCLVSYALGGMANVGLAEQIFQAYFPYIQGLHIMLDYFIDQVEDTKEGDLNFCAFYDSRTELEQRMRGFITKAKEKAEKLPHARFHMLVAKGLVGLYLSDPKVNKLANAKQMKKNWLREGGPGATFFYWNTKLYYSAVKGMR